MAKYSILKRVNSLPRYPRAGSIDLTYRCNYRCRHCWLNSRSVINEKDNELSLPEITKLVDDARKLGCHNWAISGGEPLIREDFTDIFEYIIKNTNTYSINTNGSLITPKIANLFKNKGNKMISLYGSTAEVHDYITRSPGSFDALIQGISYLKESNAAFTVQIIPMRDNYHQLNDMIRLSESLSPYWRFGATWLHLTADGNQRRNREIIEQRIDPSKIVRIASSENPPEDSGGYEGNRSNLRARIEDRVFINCIFRKNEFHVDPYGEMTFCCFIKDPMLFCSVRNDSFKRCWEELLPALSDRVLANEEYLKNCGSCELKGDCVCCPAYAYLEHRRYSARVEYLCSITKEQRNLKDKRKEYNRYFRLADLSIKITSDLPITPDSICKRLRPFEIAPSVKHDISLRLRFFLPDLKRIDLGKAIYEKHPWLIYKYMNSWIYVHNPVNRNSCPKKIAVLSNDYKKVTIYNPNARISYKGGLKFLVLFPPDRVFLTWAIANREGCYLRAAGIAVDNMGLLLIGHIRGDISSLLPISGHKATIIGDREIVLMKSKEGYRIHRTWSTSQTSQIINSSTPLAAVAILHKEIGNGIEAVVEKSRIVREISRSIVEPLGISPQSRKRELSLIKDISHSANCYEIRYSDIKKLGSFLGEIKNGQK